MFELPEVEIVRRELDRDVVGRKVKTAEAASMKALRRYRIRKAFTSQLVGRKIEAVQRRGLFITFRLTDERTLVVSLGASGSLRRHPNKDPVAPHTEVVITFTQYGQLRLVDADRTADMFVVDTAALDAELPGVADLGFDPIEDQLSWTDFGREVLRRRTKLKMLLTDPSFIVGIGAIYSDEILYEAGLRFDRMSDSLSTQELRRLHRAVVGTIHNAIKYRGTSVPERPFVDPYGQPGVFAEHLEVWGRQGQLSGRSRRPIQRVRHRGEWTYFCDTQN